MLAAISPDSLSTIERPDDDLRSADDDSTAQATARSREAELVAATHDYLGCLKAGSLPPSDLCAAWDGFYRTYRPVVACLIRSHCRASDEAADRVQEVWQTIVTHLATFRPGPNQSPFRAWLVVVAQRRIIDWRRRESRQLHPVLWDEPPDHLEGTEPDPAIVCERDDDHARVTQLLKHLKSQASPLSYRVLELRSVEGRSGTEVARLLGLTLDQIRARHHRMMVQLRQLARVDAEQDQVDSGKIAKNFGLSRNAFAAPAILVSRGREESRPLDH